MSKPSKKTSGYPSAPKSFVSHLLTRSSGQSAPIRAWIQGVVVWFCDTTIAVDDGTGIAVVSLSDKRWWRPDGEFTPSLGLYVGVVGTLKTAPADGGRYLHMAGWRVLDLHEEPSVDELWVAEVIDIRLSAADAVRAT